MTLLFDPFRLIQRYMEKENDKLYKEPQKRPPSMESSYNLISLFLQRDYFIYICRNLHFLKLFILLKDCMVESGKLNDVYAFPKITC